MFARPVYVSTRRRYWKTHDLCDLFASVASGRLPLRLDSNYDTEEMDWSVKLNPVWPACIPDDPPVKIIVEDGVPLPPKYRQREEAKALTKVVSEMKPGQSFFMPSSDTESPEHIRARVNHAKKMSGALISTRQVTEGDPPVKGLRVWRLA